MLKFTKKLSFRQAVILAAKEYWQEYEFIHNWDREISDTAKEVVTLVDDDPNMSFEEAYDLVMDY
jgi:hypothetical protein